MHPLIAQIEEKLLPEFRKITERITQTIPNVSVRIESHSVGFDEYLGHSLNISCLFTKDYPTEVDDVALCVNISHLVSTPKIDAYVCWGYPSAYLEAEFPVHNKGSLNNSLTVTDEVLEDLYKKLPRLYSALFKALRRRKPNNE